MAWVTGTNSFLWGDTGTGKSSIVEWMAALTGSVFVRVNMDSGIDRSHFVGKDTITVDPKTGSPVTRFMEGVLVQAMKMPAIFLVDEIDFAPSDVLYVLQRLLEGKGLLLAEEGNRFYPAAPGFRFVATANTNGQGDTRAVYRGARELSLAFRERFGAWLKVDYLEARSEIALIERMFPALKVSPTKAFSAEQIVQFAKEIQAAFRQGKLMEVVSPRSLIAITDIYVRLGMDREAMGTALDLVVRNRLDDQSEAVVKGLVSSVFGPL
jgi:cobaltochelatase CobS